MVSGNTIKSEILRALLSNLVKPNGLFNANRELCQLTILPQSLKSQDGCVFAILERVAHTDNMYTVILYCVFCNGDKVLWYTHAGGMSLVECRCLSACILWAWPISLFLSVAAILATSHG